MLVSGYDRSNNGKMITTTNSLLAVFGKAARAEARHGLIITHPLPRLNEAKKIVCHLTDLGNLAEEQRAYHYDRASLHGVDNYFQLVCDDAFTDQRTWRCVKNRRVRSKSGRHAAQQGGASAVTSERAARCRLDHAAERTRFIVMR